MFLKLGVTIPCTQLHPANFNLHPDHLSLHPVLCNILNVTRTSVLHVSGNFPKFRPKNSKLSILTQNWPIRKFGGADSKSGLSFLKFWTQNPFLGKFGPKSQSYQFCLKIGTYGIWRMLILIPTLVSWICNPKSVFGQIWAKKFKVVHFDWNLAHRVSRGCWLLLLH